MLTEKNRGFVSLVVLALFMAIIFCTSAFAGKGKPGGDKTTEEIIFGNLFRHNPNGQ